MASEVEREPRGSAKFEEAAVLTGVGPTLAEKLGLRKSLKGNASTVKSPDIN